MALTYRKIVFATTVWMQELLSRMRMERSSGESMAISQPNKTPMPKRLPRRKLLDVWTPSPNEVKLSFFEEDNTGVHT